MVQRYVVLAFIIGAILLGLTVNSAAESILAQYEVQNAPVLGGVLRYSSATAIASAFAVFVALIRNTRAVRFSSEVIRELFLVVWPTKDETLRASTTVVVTTIFVAALLGSYDFVWKKVADFFLFNGG